MSLRKKEVFFVCIFLFILIAGDGFSYELQEIQVVASPIIEGNIVDDFASTTTRVTEAQMEDLNAIDLGTALRRTPGVNISRYNMVGSFGGAEGGGIFIRGMGSSRPGGEIRTYIDGVPMYMSVWNHPLLDLLSLDAAHALQVYKSPQPQHFGNAFATINVEPKRRTQPGFESMFRLAAGSFGTIIESVEHGGNLGNADYYLGQSFKHSDGHRSHADGDLNNYFARLGARYGEHWEGSLFGLFTDNAAHDPGEKGAAARTRNGEYTTRALMGIFTLQHKYEHAQGFVKAFVNTGAGDWRDQRPPDKNTLNDFTFAGLRAQEALLLWEEAQLLLGLDYDTINGQAQFENAQGRRKNWEGPSSHIFSPYIAFSQTFGSHEGLYAIPSAGVRFYTHNEFAEEWAPHAGILLGYKNTEFHAGYARGVLYPGLEVAVLSEAILPRLGSSWKDLHAETLDHYELGVSQRISWARADVTVFQDRGKNRYVIVPPPPGPPAYANVGSYKTTGLEATLHLYPTENIAFFLGATFLDTDTNRPYAPHTTLSAGINWAFWDNFRLSLDTQYVSDMQVTSQARKKGARSSAEIDAYWLLNGKLCYTVPVEQCALEVFLAGENITGTRYEYLPGYPMPEANGMVGMTLRF